MAKDKKVYDQATDDRLARELVIINRVNPQNDKWNLSLH